MGAEHRTGWGEQCGSRGRGLGAMQKGWDLILRVRPRVTDEGVFWIRLLVAVGEADLERHEPAGRTGGFRQRSWAEAVEMEREDRLKAGGEGRTFISHKWKRGEWPRVILGF